MAVADDLEAAARILTEKGWCQEVLEEEDGRLCLIGAISKVANYDFEEGAGMDNFDRYYAAYQAVASEIDSEYLPSGWNDEAGRTKEEVVGVLLKAAERARGEVGG